MTLLRTLLVSASGLLAAPALSQTPAAPDAVRQYFDRKAGAMTVLSAWGGANVLVGGAGALASDGERARQFHLMNAGWGAVNLALGLFGRRSARRDAAAGTDAAAAYADLRRTEKILLFNAGLDLGYVAAGAYLLERSRRPDSDTRERDRGWGQSVMIQGAALFAFDLLAYRYLHRAESRLSVGPGARIGVRLGR